MTSLTRRAVVTVVVVEFLCALAISGTALWHERWTRFRSFDEMLMGRSDSLLGAVQDAEDPDDNVKIDPEELEVPTDDSYAVYNFDGRLLGSSAYALPSLAIRPRDGFSTLRVGHREYRLLQRRGLRVIDREETGGAGLRRPVIILYAARTDFIWREIFAAARFYVLVSLTLLCATTAILIVSLRRMLRPLRELAVAASAIDAHSLSFEPPASALRLRESKPLADALSAAVARLRQAFETEHRFVGDASHELKTAVAVVRSSLQVMSMRPRSTEEYQLGIDQVLNDNERVEALAARMLTLARFEELRAGEFVEVNLGESVEITIQNLQSFAEIHNVSMAASLEPEVLVRMTREGAQVLISNLVLNAIQHSPKGATVFVTLRRTTEPEGLAVLEVKDSGAGVPADKLPHVFERFYRADPSRSRQTGGTGLGLAICKSIVDAVDGTIEMQSQQGHGTVVKATFRLA
jgi:signal transduction histidine kinase